MVREQENIRIERGMTTPQMCLYELSSPFLQIWPANLFVCVKYWLKKDMDNRKNEKSNRIGKKMSKRRTMRNPAKNRYLKMELKRVHAPSRYPEWKITSCLRSVPHVVHHLWSHMMQICVSQPADLSNVRLQFGHLCTSLWFSYAQTPSDCLKFCSQEILPWLASLHLPHIFIRQIEFGQTIILLFLLSRLVFIFKTLLHSTLGQNIRFSSSSTFLLFWYFWYLCWKSRESTSFISSWVGLEPQP